MNARGEPMKWWQWPLLVLMGLAQVTTATAVWIGLFYLIFLGS